MSEKDTLKNNSKKKRRWTIIGWRTLGGIHNDHEETEEENFTNRRHIGRKPREVGTTVLRPLDTLKDAPDATRKADGPRCAG